MDRTETVVLGVVGSPRRGGATERLVGEVLLGARDAEARTDTLSPADVELRPCVACGQCVRTGRCAEPTLQMLRRSLDFRSVELLGSVVDPGLLDAGDVVARSDLLKEAYDVGWRSAAGAGGESPAFGGRRCTY